MKFLFHTIVRALSFNVFSNEKSQSFSTKCIIAHRKKWSQKVSTNLSILNTTGAMWFDCNLEECNPLILFTEHSTKFLIWQLRKATLNWAKQNSTNKKRIKQFNFKVYVEFQNKSIKQMKMKVFFFFWVATVWSIEHIPPNIYDAFIAFFIWSYNLNYFLADIYSTSLKLFISIAWKFKKRMLFLWMEKEWWVEFFDLLNGCYDYSTTKNLSYTSVFF